MYLLKNDRFLRSWWESIFSSLAISWEDSISAGDTTWSETRKSLATLTGLMGASLASTLSYEIIIKLKHPLKIWRSNKRLPLYNNTHGNTFAGLIATSSTRPCWRAANSSTERRRRHAVVEMNCEEAAHVMTVALVSVEVTVEKMNVVEVLVRKRLNKL